MASYLQQAVCVRRKNESKKTKRNKIRPAQNTPRYPQQTATTSRRRATKLVPRVSPYSLDSIVPGLWKSTSYSSRNCLWQNRPRSLRSLGLFFCLTAAQKKRVKTIHHRHQQSSQRPPQGIPLLQSCEVALERVSDPLGARGNILPASVGSGRTWSESISTLFEKMQTSPCPAAFLRKPQEHVKAHGSYSTSHY